MDTASTRINGTFRWLILLVVLNCCVFFTSFGIAFDNSTDVTDPGSVESRFPFPETLPFSSLEFQSSSPFTLKEQLNGEFPPQGDCLSFETRPTCGDPNAGSTLALSNTLLLTALAASSVTTNKFGTVIASLSIALSLCSAFAQSEEDAAADNTSRVLALDFSTLPCNASGLSCPQQVFRFESWHSQWGRYGWISVYDFSAKESSLPRCLTKGSSELFEFYPSDYRNRLSIQDCSFVYDSNFNRLARTDQLWSFGEITENGVINQLTNAQDDIDTNADINTNCITGISSIDRCRRFWVGEVFLENGCTYYPDYRPAICGLKGKTIEH